MVTTTDDYYHRHSAVHVDGTPIFGNAADAEAERVVAAAVAKLWQCEVHRFGLLSPVDWYCTRAGRLIGVLELKHRSHESAKFETVFLNVRKWLTLLTAEVGLGVPALFVVQFQDGVRWCRVTAIDARRHRIGGCARRVKADSDIEPLIEVPIIEMRVLRERVA